jgi:hypothetical protein
MSMPAPGELVRDLLHMRVPLDELVAALAPFAIDCAPDQKQTLERDCAVQHLDAFIAGEIALDTLEYWAMLVGHRDDIAFEGESDVLKEMVFVLGHPGVNRRLDRARAQSWRDALILEAHAGS